MTYSLLVECNDATGLIAKITTALFENKVNIVSNWEFVDQDRQRFYMRADFEGACDIEKLQENLIEKLPDGAWICLKEPCKKNIIILATKEAHCLGDLLLRSKFGDFNGAIQAVISNHETLRPLVEKFCIPFHYLPHQEVDRETHEKQIVDVIQQYSVEYLVLAKYMRILTPQFVSQFPNQIINIHHSFLPAFIGANPYKQAYQRGVKIIGATAHFVTDDLDEGPIIAQNTIRVDHSHGFHDMAHAGQDVEKITLSKALQLVLEDRVFITGNRTIIFE